MRAAVALVVEAGPEALTLASVATRAKVSKGGFLYHFRSREALIRELIALAISKVSSSDVTEAPSEDAGAPFDAEIVAGVVLGLVSGPLIRIWMGHAFSECGPGRGRGATDDASTNKGRTVLRNITAWLCAAEQSMS